MCLAVSLVIFCPPLGCGVGQATHDGQAIMNGQPPQTEEVVESVYYDIDLPIDLQDYVREVCSKYNMDLELALAIMCVESKFDIKAKSKNKSGKGYSVGLMQINTGNKAYIEWYGELTRIEKFNPDNVYHNIEAGIAVYKDYEKLWQERGYEGEELMKITLLSYNRGVTGARMYMERYGIQKGLKNDYIVKVLNAIDELKLKNN